MAGIEFIFILVALPLCVGLILTSDNPQDKPRPYNWEEDQWQL